MDSEKAIFSRPVFSKNIQFIPLDKIKVMIPGWNVRENDIRTYWDADIQATAPTEGQRDTALLYEVTENDLKTFLSWTANHGVQVGDYLPIKGNRRAFNFQEMAKRGVIDPTTVKRDAKGQVIPNSGKPFSTLRAEVVKELDETSLFNAKLDQTARPLSKVEVHYALENARKLFVTEKAVAIRMKALLDRYYKAPPSDLEVLDTPEKEVKYHAFRKGVLQNVQAVSEGPTVLRNAYIESLRRGTSNPNQKEVGKGYSIYKAEKEEDTRTMSMKINKDQPGPKFMEWWNNDYLVSVRNAEETATRRKAAANLNADQIKKLMEGADSKTFRFALLIVQNKVQGPMIAEYNRGLLDLETGKATIADFMVSLEKMLSTVAAQQQAVEAQPEPATSETKAA